MAELNGYICFYKDKKYEIQAFTTLGAREILANLLKIRKPHMVTVMLAEKGGVPVVHSTAGIG